MGIDYPILFLIPCNKIKLRKKPFKVYIGIFNDLYERHLKNFHH